MTLTDRTFLAYAHGRQASPPPSGADRVLIIDPPGSIVQTLTLDGLGQKIVTAFPPPGKHFTDCVGGAQSYHVPISIAAPSPVGPVELTINPGGVAPIEVFLGEEWREIAPGVRITLSPGTQANPLTNYVYGEWDGAAVAYVVDTVGWPTAEHWRIAAVTLGTAAAVFADPAQGIVHIAQGQAWFCNDSSGLLPELAAAIAERPPVYISGGELTITGPGTSALAAGLGSVEMHRLRRVSIPAQPAPARWWVPALNWASSDTIAGPVPATSLLRLRDGSPLAANRYGVFTFGIAAGDDGAIDHLWIGLPVDDYLDLDQAKSDASGYGDYSIPAPFRGSAVLVARAAIRYQSAPSFMWTVAYQEAIAVTGAGASVVGAPAVTRFSEGEFRVLATASTAEVGFDLSGLASGEVILQIPPSPGGTVMTLVPMPPSSTSPGALGQMAISPTHAAFYTGPGWGRVALQTSF